ncbi:hypothetical protein Esti_004937 [Eimeria stiedai]
MLPLLRFMRPAETAMLAHHASHFLCNHGSNSSSKSSSRSGSKGRSSRMRTEEEEIEGDSRSSGDAVTLQQHEGRHTQRSTEVQKQEQQQQIEQQQQQQDWWLQFGREAVNHLQDADGREVAMLLAAIAKSQVQQPLLLPVLLAEAAAWAQDNAPRNNALILHSLGRIGCSSSEAAVTAACEGLKKKAFELNHIDCCMAIHGAARLKVKDALFYDCLLRQAERLLPLMDEHNLSMMVWALGTLGLVNEQFLLAAAKHLLRLCGSREIPSRYVAPLLNGFGRLGFGPPIVLEFADAALRNVARMHPLDLCIACTALARLGLSVEKDRVVRPLLRRLGSLVEKGAVSAPRHLANLAAAASSLDPQATERGLWGPLGPLLVSRVLESRSAKNIQTFSFYITDKIHGILLPHRAPDFPPSDAATLALCLQRLNHQQQQQQDQQHQQQDEQQQQQQHEERGNNRIDWIHDFFRELDESASRLHLHVSLHRPPCLLHVICLPLLSLPGCGEGRVEGSSSEGRLQRRVCCSKVRGAMQQPQQQQQQQQQQQDGDTTLSPQDATRLLQALAALPRQQLSGRSRAAAEAAVAHAAKHKNLYSKKQQKDAADAVSQLGLEVEGLKEWMVQQHKRCSSEEPVEVSASREEHAEVYLHLDAENPMMRIRSEGESKKESQTS